MGISNPHKHLWHNDERLASPFLQSIPFTEGRRNSTTIDCIIDEFTAITSSTFAIFFLSYADFPVKQLGLRLYMTVSKDNIAPVYPHSLTHIKRTIIEICAA